ncbi:MAG: hypothetical protein JW923_10435 [Spirochaetales bacterium]|nr:hypothetical protein [Spirochaetales bacterium]
MEVILVAKSRSAELLFSLPRLTRFQPSELDAILASPPADCLLYIDLGSLPRRGLPELLARLADEKRLRWAALDRARAVSDPAALFHTGALDYIGPEAGEGFVNEERLDSVAAYAAKLSGDQARAPARRTRTASGFVGWDALSEGKDYEFLMVYVALCDADALRTRLGDARFTRLKSAVLSTIGTLAAEHEGLVWMGDGQSTLVLFQPDHLPSVFRSCMRVLAGIRLLSYEQFRMDQDDIQLAFSLLKARLPWQKPGNTGTVVSDAINYIHHLGRRHTAPGTIDLAGDTADALPDRLKTLLSDAGDFEYKPVRRFAGFVTTCSG